ncbi:MAG: tRNA (N(6)-L-threonylcarbamoyladenosine(37)-C(2))-methylthiotransferase MtaB [Limnochordales bacterium]|nr:tRNA (N(6)-L-threonylcarbamoyladenosine(37)-C(2))-methylthiotransferase MtaB [Limnochordales bacterium]
MRIGLVSLGCKVNQYELDAIGAELARRGYICVGPDEPAEAYCVNTCAVTSTSEKKCRQLIRRLHHLNPDAVIVVMGCYSQRAAAEVAALPGVRLVVGTEGRRRIPDWIDRLLGGRGQPPLPAIVEVSSPYRRQEYEELPLALTNLSRAVVKAQDGCSLFCTYCAIPHLRGPSRSRNPAAVLREIEQLVNAGYKEIVLTGVHLAGYGADLGDGWNLARLVAAIGEIGGLARLRLSSLHPNEVDDELLSVLTRLESFCPHFHLPVQSGDDEVLRRMRRRYTASDVLRLAEKLRRLWPDVALTTDLITGFPGESEEAFARTVSLCREVGFSRLHVFPFSPRPGTPAARYPDQLPVKVREDRARELIRVGHELAAAYHRRFLGREVEVLAEEEEEKGRLVGLTRTYVRVHFESREGAKQLRQLLQVKVTAFNHEGLQAVHEVA